MTIENPFGTDPNDLPLESICETIRKSVTEILAMLLRAPSAGPSTDQRLIRFQ